MEGARAHAHRTVTENDDLLHAVRCRHAHAPLPAQLIGGALDIGIGGLRLPGVDDLDPVHRLHAAGVSLDLVGVKHQDHHALAEPLIVGENTHEHLARGVNVLRGNGFELVPCKDDVVAVDKQVLRVGVLRPNIVFALVQRGARRLFRRFKRLALDLSVGALKNALQLLVLFKGAGRRAAAGGGLFPGVLRFPKLHAAVAVHPRGDLVPRDRDAAAVVAEDGRGGIVGVALGVVAER